MFTITKLTSTDLPLARELLREWFLDDGIADPMLPVDAYLKKLLAQQTFHVYVATVGGRVVGGLSAYELTMFDKEENEMFLYEIGVSQQFRQRGIARALIEALKHTCRRKGIRVVFVATSLDNEAARQLYRTTGADEEILPFFTFELDQEEGW